MKSSSEIILNKENLQSNWDFLRQHFGDVLISAVVKGNAYGHGINTYIPLAEECGVNHFSVYSANEARQVHSVAGKDTTIMIMGDMNDDDVHWAIDNEIQFFVFDTRRLDYVVKVAKEKKKKALVHIEVETGMHRTGFEPKQIPVLIERLKSFDDELTLQGLCMHFAGAENITNYVRTKQQKILFKKIVKQFEKADLRPKQIHACCSAASMRFPDMHYDMLRIGIMQYGFWPSPEIMVEYMSKKQLVISPLKRIISWKSYVMSIKDVPAGAFVGYGSSFFAHHKMKMAVVPIGYAHGFSRGLSNVGMVLIQGIRVPVIGTVNMNCISVDVSLCGEIDLGDEVIMIGEDGEHEVSVASFGEMSNQLNYELLTRLPHDIPRRIE